MLYNQNKFTSVYPISSTAEHLKTCIIRYKYVCNLKIIKEWEKSSVTMKFQAAFDGNCRTVK